MPTSSDPSAHQTSFSWLELLRMMYAAGGVLAIQSGLHGELARIEWAEEKSRLLQMLLALLFGVVFLIVWLLSGSVLALLLVWNTPYRIPVLALLVIGHGVGVGIAWWRFHLLSERSELAFAATREELAADIALFGSKP